MNPGRLVLAVIVGFIFIFGSDVLIHGFWLAPDYKITASLWRSEDEMHRRLLIMIGAQFLCALSFLYIWARTGWRRRSVVDGCVFGFWIGLFGQVAIIAQYVTTYLPWWLAAKWIGAGLGQSILLGVIAALVYKPRAILTDRPSV